MSSENDVRQSISAAETGASGSVWQPYVIDREAMTTDEFVIPMDDGVRLYGWVLHKRPVKPRAVMLHVTFWVCPSLTDDLGDGRTRPQQAGDPEVMLQNKAGNPLVYLGPDDFAFVHVHVRGLGASEGHFDCFGRRARQDSQAILNFIAAQPWCSGSIVVSGGSGQAIMAYPLAATNHPALKAVAPVTTSSDLYRLAATGGVLRPIFAGLALTAMMSLAEPWYQQARERLGLRGDVAEQQAAAQAAAQEASRHALRSDPYWQEHSDWDSAPHSTVPMLLMSSWLDGNAFTDAAVLFRRYPNSWLCMGYGHDGPARVIEHYAFPMLARFFRHFALGEDNGFEREPRALLPIALGSVMGYAFGRTLVRGEQSWPLEGTRWERLYLSTELSGSATSLNDGSLQLAAPASEPADKIDVTTQLPSQFGIRSRHQKVGKWVQRVSARDPEDSTAVPAPSQNMTEQAQQAGISVDVSKLSHLNPEPPTELTSLPPRDTEQIIAVGDQVVDLRGDEHQQLTYTTAPFTQHVELTGPLTIRLYASSTVGDFVWVVRVADVHPNGTSIWFSDTLHRAAFRRLDESATERDDTGEVIMARHAFNRLEPFRTGEVVECILAPEPISNVFLAGHRLRLDLGCITGQDLIGSDATGTVQIHHDQEYLSQIRIPLIPSRLTKARVAFDGVQHPNESASSLDVALASEG